MENQYKGSIVWHTIGKLLMIVAGSMVFPLVTAFLYQEKNCIYIFALLLPFVLLIGALLSFLLRPDQKKVHIQVRDGAAIVTYSWILAAAIGTIPYLLAGTLPTMADAFFESSSGFATVGASVMDDIEGAPYSILMWRSVTHWLGGMGIIVLFVALLSNMGAGAMQIFKAEAAGPVKDKLHPKIADSARSLWALYLFNTAITTVMLLFSGMNAFDAINHAFSIVATGGFSTRNSSIGAYQSPLIEWVVTGSMYLSGINYALLYFVYRHRSLRRFWVNKEFRVYTYVTLGAVLLITGDILPQYQYDFWTALRHSAFHVTSILTTTGFVCYDYELWVPAAKLLLVLLMFSGACAGSTTCGFKIDRHIMLFQQIGCEVQRFLHPRLVRTLKANQKNLPEPVMHSVTSFFYLFMFFTVLCTLILCCMGLDLLDALTGVLGCLGGVGPAMGHWGPTESFSSAPGAAKWLLSFLMLLGRLEIYTVLAVLWPDKHKHLRYKKLQFFSERDV